MLLLPLITCPFEKNEMQGMKCSSKLTPTNKSLSLNVSNFLVKLVFLNYGSEFDQMEKQLYLKGEKVHLKLTKSIF